MEGERHPAGQTAERNGPAKHLAEKRYQSLALEVNRSETIEANLPKALHAQTKRAGDHASQASQLQAKAQQDQVTE